MDLVRLVADAYLETSEGSDAARITFLKGLWEIQATAEATAPDYEARDSKTALQSLVNGESLFMSNPPVVPRAEYLNAVSQLVDYIVEAAGLPAEQAEALRAADFARAIDDGSLENVVRSPEGFVAYVASELGAKPEGPLTPATVTFVLVSALVPFLTGASKQALDALGEFDYHAWGRGSCPVCSAPAAVGRVGESTALQGAERTLWCGLCHAEWGYERIKCVRCGCTSPEKLKYSHVEDDSAHRLHLCDECHGYARFVFEDELGKPVSMIVEDAVTATLDAIAVEGGYTASGDGGSGSC